MKEANRLVSGEGHRHARSLGPNLADEINRDFDKKHPGMPKPNRQAGRGSRRGMRRRRNTHCIYCPCSEALPRWEHPQIESSLPTVLSAASTRVFRRWTPPTTLWSGVPKVGIRMADS